MWEHRVIGKGWKCAEEGTTATLSGISRCGIESISVGDIVTGAFIDQHTLNRLYQGLGEIQDCNKDTHEAYPKGQETAINLPAPRLPTHRGVSTRWKQTYTRDKIFERVFILSLSIPHMSSIIPLQFSRWNWYVILLEPDYISSIVTLACRKWANGPLCFSTSRRQLNTSVEKGIKSLVRIAFVRLPFPSNNGLQFSKSLIILLTVSTSISITAFEPIVGHLPDSALYFQSRPLLSMVRADKYIPRTRTQL